MVQITDRTALEAALAADLFLLFKHSPICAVSRWAFGQVAAFRATHPEVPTGWIDVIAQRAWSQWVEATTGVPHASPQVLLIRGGAVAWHTSQARIRSDAVAQALTAPA